MYQMKTTDVFSEAIPVPAAITLADLRRHFKETYGLSPAQIDVMVESSSKSLAQAFSQAIAAINTADPRPELAPVFHGLKGLFLNMGENEWAAFAREVEQRLKKQEPCDFTMVIEEMQAGLSEILFYCRDKREEKT